MKKRDRGGAFRIVLVLWAVILWPPITSGAVVTVNLHDSIEAMGNDSNLDGTWDNFSLGPIEYLFVHNGGAGFNYRSVLEFDLSSIPTYATIDSATFLIAYGGASGFPALSMQFNGFVGTGTIHPTDFQVQNQIGPRFDAFGPAFPELLYRVPATAFIQSFVSNQNQFAAFMVENVTLNQTFLRGSLSSSPPLLQVAYNVPEPTSWAPAACLGILLLSRGQKTSQP